jgi:hypothetical protein
VISEALEKEKVTMMKKEEEEQEERREQVRSFCTKPQHTRCQDDRGEERNGHRWVKNNG